jgi:hypothetical protein
MRLNVLTSVMSMSVLVVSSIAGAASLASDSAAHPVYASGWANGSNGGTGFAPWELKTSGNANFNEFAGHFTAGGSNSDLNEIATAGRAWGTFANDANSTETTQIAGAFRNLTGGALATDGSQSIRVRMEHGLIRNQGSLSAGVEPARTRGFAGIILNPAPQWEPDPFDGFGSLAGAFAVGFVGGDANYSIFVPGGAPTQIVTNVPFGIGGHEFTLTPTGSSTWRVDILRLSDNQLFTFTGNGTIGAVNRVGLINRNAEDGNVYFNSLAVIPEPATLGAFGAAVVVLLRRTRSRN